MKGITRFLVSLFCMAAIGVFTFIGLYEVYNSYLSSDPKNIVTYHQAATMKNADIISIPEKASDDVASPATAQKATAENSIASKKQ